MKCLVSGKAQTRRFPLPKLSNCQFFRRGNFQRCAGFGNIRSLLSSPRSTKSGKRPTICKANSLDPSRPQADFSVKNGFARGKRCFTEGISPNRHPFDSNPFERTDKIFPAIKVDLSNLLHPKDNSKLYHRKIHKPKLSPLEDTKEIKENSGEGLRFTGKIAQILNLDLSFRCKPKLSPAGNRTLEMLRFRKTPRFTANNQKTKQGVKEQPKNPLVNYSMEDACDCNVTFGKEQFANITCKLPFE